MRRKHLLPLALLIATWPALTLAQNVTVIHAGRLLADPATGRVETNRSIIVRDARIQAIRDGFVTEPNAIVVDLRDSFVLPGLIDSHVHLCHENGANDKLDRVTKTSADWTIECVRNADKTLRAGFTTVANLGDENDAIFALRDGIASGKVRGPRVIAAGNVISPHGGEGDIHGYRPDVIKVLQRPALCSGAEECRRIVRQQIQRGADVIKIVATGAVLSDVAAGVGQQFTADELSAIVETAHSLGRQVTAHAHAAGGINAALTAGVDSIEHGTFFDERSAELFKKHSAYLIPTLLAGATVTQWASDPNGFLSPQARDKALQVGPKMLDMARRARVAGIKVAFGTDASVAPHGTNAREFALLVQAGFTPLQAIQTATVAGADHLGLSKEIGSIAIDKAADVIAVKGNPLQDVAELARVQFVMKGGEIIAGDRAGAEGHE